MKFLPRLAFCIALLVSACGINVYGAVRLVGDGSINFDGTGQFLVQRFPFLEFVTFSNNCTPHEFPGIVFLCAQPLDMSLLGNDIVRAEHVRIGISIHDLRTGFALRFGCPTCSTFVSVDEDDLVPVSGGWRLSDQANHALQALIDQHGAGSIYMSVLLQGGSVDIFSSVQVVVMDIKPGDGPNTLNPRSNGVIPVAILTTEQFDATSIDVPSLRFGATGEEASAVRAIFDDVDGDGDPDLLVFFRSRDTGIDCKTLFTYISGKTSTGADIAGTDSVNVVGCRP